MAQSRSKASGRAKRRRRSGAGQPARRKADPDLERILADVVRSVRIDVKTIDTAADAESWASSVAALWTRGPSIGGPDLAELVGGGVVRGLLRAGDEAALATLRALAAVVESPLATAAAKAGDALAAVGIEDPAWVEGLGGARPVQAKLMREDIFDDGVSVMVEFEVPGDELQTLGVYVDHNLSGSAKDIFVGGSMEEVEQVLATAPDDGFGVRLEEISLGEAAARMREGLGLTDMTLGAPVSEDYWSLRALAGARLRALPDGASLPERRDVEPEERQRLLDDFFAAVEGAPFRSDPYAEDAVAVAIDYAADYSDGRPLRWSPTVVELFMTDWLPRKVAHEPAFFDAVPAALRAWVCFAGRRRGIPEHAIQAVTAAVDEWADELVATSANRDAWGPAKALAAAMSEAGIDPGDEQAMDAFLDRLNAEGGIPGGP
jgi:hypothetical protein